MKSVPIIEEHAWNIINYSCVKREKTLCNKRLYEEWNDKRQAQSQRAKPCWKCINNKVEQKEVEVKMSSLRMMMKRRRSKKKKRIDMQEGNVDDDWEK